MRCSLDVLYSSIPDWRPRFRIFKILSRIRSSMVTHLYLNVHFLERKCHFLLKKLSEKGLIRGFTTIFINLITINFYQIIATSLVHLKICTVHLRTALYVSASHCLVFLEWYCTVKQSCFNFKHSGLRGRQAKHCNKPKIFTVSSRLNRF